MKRVIKIFVVELLVLYFVSNITTGLYFRNGAGSLVLTALGLAVATLFVRPIINLLLLPINLLTFGFFRFLTNAIMLFLVSLALKSEFVIGAFVFGGYKGQLIGFPSISLPAGILSYFAFSLLISVISGAIYWLIN